MSDYRYNSQSKPDYHLYIGPEDNRWIELEGRKVVVIIVLFLLFLIWL